MTTVLLENPFRIEPFIAFIAAIDLSQHNTRCTVAEGVGFNDPLRALYAAKIQ
ncbi:hypothetical protein [Xenorhabdus hominickii]|uniref:Uncharacterized protein n=1 Tax=Xenorhabdus hominickii TaxID=351679 RepID=A0A2G0QB56_XENHO|nr:hypothetical protein [Xenorhabdus hominickii]PHM56477.1 hypothetical protein Xhom_01969 [Xenorhabdus hominickii]